MAKTPNYTVAQVERMTEVYRPTATESERKVQVTTLATEFDKKPNSIIAKLVNMDLYVRKPKTVSAVTGMEAQKKDALADRVSEIIEENFERPEKVAPINPDTLAKANKTDLALLIRVLEFAFPAVEVETVETEPSEEIVADENDS
jgi:hypothetical protein